MLEIPILVGVTGHVGALVDFQQVDVEGGIQEEVATKELFLGVRANIGEPSQPGFGRAHDHGNNAPDLFQHRLALFPR